MPHIPDKHKSRIDIKITSSTATLTLYLFCLNSAIGALFKCPDIFDHHIIIIVTSESFVRKILKVKLIKLSVGNQKLPAMFT